MRYRARCAMGIAGPLVACCTANVANAKTKLAADVEAALALHPDRVSSGAGGAIRLGYELDLTVLSITPEVGGSYHRLGGDLGPSVVRGFAGGRLMLGALVRPGIYAHVGAGHVAYGGAGGSGAAPTFDAGLALDLTALPVVDLGLHAGYTNVMSTTDSSSLSFVGAGAHVAFAF